MARKALLFLLLSGAALPALARPVPAVSAPELDEDDYTSTDASGDGLTELLAHVADRVGGQSQKTGRRGGGTQSAPVAQVDNRIKGMDRFIVSLANEMGPDERGQSRSDIWNYKSYQNATQAREKVKTAYDKLKDGARMLTEQKDKLKEVLDVLERVSQNHQRFVDFMRPTPQSIETFVPQITPATVDEPPRVEGGPVELGLLENIQPQQPFLDPVQARVEQAAQKIQQAKSYIDQAKGIVDGLDHYAQTAKYIVQEARKLQEEKRLPGQRSGGGSERPSLGEQVIRDAQQALRRTVAKAEAAQEEFDRLTRPREGFSDSSEKETKAEEKITQGKESLREDGNAVDGNAAAVRAQIEPWNNADPQDPVPQRQQIAAATQQQRAQADQKIPKAQQTLRDTEQAEQESRQVFQQLKEDFEKAGKLLGKKRGDQIPDLPDLNLSVDQPAVRSRASRNTRRGGSKRPKQPEVLDTPADHIVGEMDGRAYNSGDYTSR